jgi:hypothetical protein
MYIGRQLTNVLLLLVVTLSEGMAAEPDVPALTFSKGFYRQEGSCTRLVENGKDVTNSCLSNIGVWANEDDRPRFRFAQTSGNSWFFISSGPAAYSNGNRVATYPVAEMVDMYSKRFVLYAGECVISMGGGKEEIRCTTWKDKERTTVAWEGVFVGNGFWLMKPSSAPAPNPAFHTDAAR